jgi:hypothetical protein
MSLSFRFNTAEECAKGVGEVGTPRENLRYRDESFSIRFGHGDAGGQLWNSLFLEAGSDAPSFPAVFENAALAPVVAFFTFIDSMGNVPLAAMLWTKNASLGGVMSFLGADLVAATVIYIHAKYYGWRYAAFVSPLLYVCMVTAGLTVHYLYAILVFCLLRVLNSMKWSDLKSTARYGST